MLQPGCGLTISPFKTPGKLGENPYGRYNGGCIGGHPAFPNTDMMKKWLKSYGYLILLQKRTSQGPTFIDFILRVIAVFKYAL